LTQTKTDEKKDEDGSEEEDSYRESKKQHAEILKRQQIQKRVRKQLAQKQRRLKGIKNTYKQRDRRAVMAETKAWTDAFN